MPADLHALQELIGYNCRRAYLAVRDQAIKPIVENGLQRTWFTVMVLLHRNPGLSSREICWALGVQPPNLVASIASLEEHGLVERRPHSEDGRSLSLRLTAAGRRLITRVEREVERAELRATAMLSDEERDTLTDLLRRIYTEPPVD
ncbi:MAG: MarR family transcriptional regulator [Burkholderiaceae bacterium]|nr:MarR family transcriptional regulator [Burkholderiaceae bacterium]